MNGHIENKIGSTLYSKVNTLPMTQIERQKALEALHEAHLLVDGIIWVAKKVEQLSARLFLKPALKN